MITFFLLFIGSLAALFDNGKNEEKQETIEIETPASNPTYMDRQIDTLDKKMREFENGVKSLETNIRLFEEKWG